MPEQAGPRAVAAATDQHEQLRLFAADIVLRLERAAPLVAIVAGASRSEPELADLLARLHAYRRNNLRGLVDALAANGPLRLPADEAVETVWALTRPQLTNSSAASAAGHAAATAIGSPKASPSCS